MSGEHEDQQNDTRVNLSETTSEIVDSPTDTGKNTSYSSFNSCSDIDMKNCPSSTPINNSKVTSPSVLNETIHREDSFNSSKRIENNYYYKYEHNDLFDANFLIDRLRDLLKKTFYEVELCSNEMKHIVKVLRGNDVIY